MKLIAIYNNRESENKADSAGILVWPDSAFIRTRKPLFIPDENEWRLIVSLCVRIDRLGKSIQNKFASRYYNEVAPVAILLPRRAADTLSAFQNPAATDIVSDCSLVVGDFYSKEILDDISELTISAEEIGTEEVTRYTCSLKDFLLKADEAVCVASRRNTLKTGDIIIPLISTVAIKAQYDMLISAKIGENELLNFKLK